jgi:hypothetical protein
LSLQAVKCVPNGHEFEVAVRINVLGSPREPADIVDTKAPRFRSTEFDGFWFLIDGPDLGEVRGEVEGDLAGAARKIEQLAHTGRPRSHVQVVEQWSGIGKSELVVETRGSSVEIDTERGLARH